MQPARVPDLPLRVLTEMEWLSIDLAPLQTLFLSSFTKIYPDGGSDADGCTIHPGLSQYSVLRPPAGDGPAVFAGFLRINAREPAEESCGFNRRMETTGMVLLNCRRGIDFFGFL
ncbi:MAG: hypothetical protein ACKO2P_05030 [Planctomycetota bacterium]